MNNVFDYLMDIRNDGYHISFSFNDLGILTVKQHYNEYVNDRIIYGKRNRKLASVNYDTLDNTEAIESFIATVQMNLLPDNRLYLD
ncbi:MAG: hypothetical protein IKB70_06400 [Bacilli bacterium]|nr:hypothetical protein [Bacilli bacterium]